MRVCYAAIKFFYPRVVPLQKAEKFPLADNVT
jgi:hypothetical protein